MRRLVALSIVVFAVLGGGVANSTIDPHQSRHFKHNLFHGHHAAKQHHANVWLLKWQRADLSIYPAVHIASVVFHVSENTMLGIVGGEGGNVDPFTLHRSLCSGSQPGWNNGGSYAFGPFQFMLDRKPACDTQTEWGTFGSYDDAAFQAAKKLGVSVPYRFKTPASNVGQAITAAYMVSIGGLCVHWGQSMC